MGAIMNFSNILLVNMSEGADALLTPRQGTYLIGFVNFAGSAAGVFSWAIARSNVAYKRPVLPRYTRKLILSKRAKRAPTAHLRRSARRETKIASFVRLVST